MYATLESIKMIQLDHTSRCNLSCPQCSRFFNGWLDDKSCQNLDLSLDDYKLIFEPITSIETVFHCGNYGDAIASPTFNETFTYTLSRKPKTLRIATNGSLRSPEWWRDLAEEGKDCLDIDFAIDGLSDTLSTYRVGASWKKLMDNTSSYIKAGGRACWNFLVFEHNAHQVDEAKKMADDLGFAVFRTKYSSRFVERKKAEIEGKNGKVKEKSGPNPAREEYNTLKKTETFKRYVNSTEISCKFKKRNSLFIDFKMNLWPCCWFGIFPHSKRPTGMPNGFKDFEALFGKDFNNLRKHGWDVLNQEFFGNYLERTWGNDPAYPRIRACGRACGKKYDHSSGWGKNIVEKKLGESLPGFMG